MTISFEKRWIVVFILFQTSFLLLAFVGGMFVDRWWGSSRAEFPVLGEAYSIIQNHALFELPSAKKMEYGMIRGMVTTLNDPHTSFVEPPQHELQSQQLAGQYGGIGARIEIDGEGYYLLYPYPDSPARKAGVQDGDRLVAIDGWVIPADVTNDEVIAALRGPEGKRVTISVYRESDDVALSFTIQRENIPIPSVTWNISSENDSVGVVRVNVIAKTSAQEILDAVQALQLQGANAFVLDLRSNSGGLVEAGVDIARLFLSGGKVLEQQYRGQPVKSFQVEQAGALADVPLVVLVNNGTASAAEIVAGALQAQKRALLVGTPTFGKDTIQLVFDLQDKSSLHVTAARWWVPGSSDVGAGSVLMPDILIPEDDVHSPTAMIEAIKVLIQ
jgi:carboxyl-terminal processing protease